MATAYPGALDTSGSQLRTDIASTDDVDATGKDQRVIDISAATWTAQVVSDWDTYWASKEPS